jgi:hypothetical protein
MVEIKETDMEVDIDERTNPSEVVFFLKATNIEEAALLMRLAGAMKDSNSGWVNYSDKTISGWVSMPLKVNKNTSIQSGKKL